MGQKKTNMNSNFLKPFVNEMSILTEDGFQWFNKMENNVVITKVFPLLCTSDAPARAAIQNFTQFNGKHGCGFCEAGVQIEKGKGSCRIYPLGESLSSKRTFETTVEYADRACEEGKPVVGVKGPSQLGKLFPEFNMVDGFVPDYMHAVLLGVVRQFVNLWTESSNSLFSMSTKHKKTLDKRITDLKLPSEATRKLRSLKDIAFWKASEWRIFLLVSPVLLTNLLKSIVYKHWILLVHGVIILLRNRISSNDIIQAELSFQKCLF